MGEEQINDIQLYYKLIDSDAEPSKIDAEIKEIPQVEADIELKDYACNRKIVFKALLGRFKIGLGNGWHKLPRKLKKRLKTHFSHFCGIKRRYIQIIKKRCEINVEF